MAYAPDLATFASLTPAQRPLPCAPSERLLLVGWLQRDEDFPIGPTSLEVFARLEELLVDPWQPFGTLGAHPCDLCRYKPEKHGARNLFVPDGTRAFVAPELVLHYMNAHGYAPPSAFCDAVLACPPTRSQEYRRALIMAGVREWLPGGGSAG